MKVLKAYLAGLVLPASLVPIVYTTLFVLEHPALDHATLPLFVLWLPVVFGLWNGCYAKCESCCTLTSRTQKLWLTGATLGVLVALVGVFVIDLPGILFGAVGGWQYLPLVMVPIVYGAVWRYLIHPLNQMLGVTE